MALYDELLLVWPSPVVALNPRGRRRRGHGPEAALALVEALEHDDRLAGYRYLPATKADLLPGWTATPRPPTPTAPPCTSRQHGGAGFLTKRASAADADSRRSDRPRARSWGPPAG